MFPPPPSFRPPPLPGGSGQHIDLPMIAVYWEQLLCMVTIYAHTRGGEGGGGARKRGGERSRSSELQCALCLTDTMQNKASCSWRAHQSMSALPPSSADDRNAGAAGVAPAVTLPATLLGKKPKLELASCCAPSAVAGCVSGACTMFSNHSAPLCRGA